MKKTYQQEQYNELHPRPKSRYEQFQEWLNECPVQIEDYQVLLILYSIKVKQQLVK